MSDETKIDSDGDGLSDAVERKLGTRINDPDSDGDGLIDGFEVAVGQVRVRDLSITDPAGSAAIVDDLVTGLEQIIGVSGHNVDSDGDGFADWVEEMRGGSSRSTADLSADAINQSGSNPNPLDEFISRAQSQLGAKNRFGAEVDLNDSSGAAEFDSSELVQWAAHQAGAELPDGSWKQFRALASAGNDIGVDAALGTKGALVFGFSSDPMASADRPDRAYVAISLGNGKVLEISERTGELVEIDAAGRNYTHAATIPEFHADAFDDTDQDGHHDIDEELVGGDPTTGMTTPWRDSFNIDTDGDGVNDAQDIEPNDPAVPNPPDASDDASGGAVQPPDDQMPVYDPDPNEESASIPDWDLDTPSFDESTTAALDVEQQNYEAASSFVEAPRYVEETTYEEPGYEEPSYGNYEDGGAAADWADG
jgi:cell wall-associated NlpC family hydrolase